MKVLFLGNSHLYFNDMPHTFARLCAAAGQPAPQTTLLAYSGRTLGWHLNEYFSLRYNLLYGGYDYCVIQQRAHPFPPSEETRADAGQVIELCRAAHTAPVLLMPWAEKACPQNQQRMAQTCRRIAAETGALLAPVGEIWQALLQQDPDFPLFWQDGEHASPLGDYLIAATLCTLLTGCDSRSLPPLGADFTGGATAIDFSHRPRVAEDPEKIRLLLDTAQCRQVTGAIAAVLGGGQG